MHVASKLNFRSPAREVRIDTTGPEFIPWDEIHGVDEVSLHLFLVLCFPLCSWFLMCIPSVSWFLRALLLSLHERGQLHGVGEVGMAGARARSLHAAWV